METAKQIKKDLRDYINRRLEDVRRAPHINLYRDQALGSVGAAWWVNAITENEREALNVELLKIAPSGTDTAL
jgi:hypothetical protein